VLAVCESDKNGLMADERGLASWEPRGEFGRGNRHSGTPRFPGRRAARRRRRRPRR